MPKPKKTEKPLALYVVVETSMRGKRRVLPGAVLKTYGFEKAKP